METIRRWRDHPTVRGASIWTGRITPDGHARWWAAVQADPGRRVLIFEFRGVACGVVTINDLDPSAATAEWGFFLDVDSLQLRGDLVPAWLALERAAIHYAFDDLGLREIGGRTLASNRPVLELHRRFGFVEVPERGYVAIVDDEAQAIVWTALTAERYRQDGPR